MVWAEMPRPDLADEYWGGKNMNVKIAEWYLKNIRALQRVYGRVDYDQKGLSWILVDRFKLPPDFNRKDSVLLIETPKENLTMKDGFNFYLNKRLVRTDGKPTTRLHDDDGYNPYRDKEYSRLSFHVHDFRPKLDVVKGDNLIDIMESLYNFLGDARGVI